MKKIIFRIILPPLFSLTFFLCFLNLTGHKINKEIENEIKSEYNLEIEKEAMVELGNGLCYDSSTMIVYLWNGYWVGDYAATPTPYYAANGLPYRYNVETNTLEEIKE